MATVSISIRLQLCNSSCKTVRAVFSSNSAVLHSPKPLVRSVASRQFRLTRHNYNTNKKLCDNNFAHFLIFRRRYGLKSILTFSRGEHFTLIFLFLYLQPPRSHSVEHGHLEKVRLSGPNPLQISHRAGLYQDNGRSSDHVVTRRTPSADGEYGLNS